LVRRQAIDATVQCDIVADVKRRATVTDLEGCVDGRHTLPLHCGRCAVVKLTVTDRRH